MSKECRYIVVDGVAYTEKPKSWLGGWAKQLAIQKYFSKIRLVSKTKWDKLVEEHGEQSIEVIHV